MQDAPTTGQPGSAQESPLAQLSAAMVRLYKEQFGRGPDQVRSSWAGPDTLLCQLWHTLTPAERSLAAMGEHQRLREARLILAHATEADFRRAVEAIFGRRIRALASGLDAREDMAVEVFVLEPAGAERPDG